MHHDGAIELLGDRGLVLRRAPALQVVMMDAIVNGARAGAFDEHGVPVVFTTRTILEEAHTLDEAIAIGTRDAPMASHMLLLADGASDESAVVERAPGLTPAVRRGAPLTVVANHYAAPSFASDPKNAFVSEHTSTVARDSSCPVWWRSKKR